MTPARETRTAMLLDLLTVISAMVAMARRSVIGEGTLQETADLPGAKKFAGCFLSGTRQRNSLPGARPGGTRQIKASGKASFAGCRHSANSSRRQKLVFAGCRPLGKIWPPAKVAGLTAASGRQPLPGATPLGTRQRIFLIFF